MKLAIVGATGLVGRKILEILEERNFYIKELFLVASDKSIGKELSYKSKLYKLISITEAVSMKPNIAIFSAGSDVSLHWAPIFAAVGTTVIDNSSAWRMDMSKKLIVPEVNAKDLCITDKIIANPNCSTIQMIMAIAPLHRAFGIKRIVVSTYQSITGSGIKALRQLENERIDRLGDMAYPYNIDMNCIPQCDSFTDNGYTKEELKLMNEANKILNDNSIKISATAVRVPVVGGHSESINIEFKREFALKDIVSILNRSEGVKVVDNPQLCEYPMPLYSKDKDSVFVGRIRRDYSRDNSINMWVVADNLRKGAATNAIQIAEYIVANSLLRN